MLIIWKTGLFIYCIHVPLEHVTFVSICNTFVYTICISFFIYAQVIGIQINYVSHLIAVNYYYVFCMHDKTGLLDNQLVNVMCINGQRLAWVIS